MRCQVKAHDLCAHTVRCDGRAATHCSHYTTSRAHVEPRTVWLFQITSQFVLSKCSPRRNALPLPYVPFWLPRVLKRNAVGYGYAGGSEVLQRELEPPKSEEVGFLSEYSHAANEKSLLGSNALLSPPPQLKTEEMDEDRAGTSEGEREQAAGAGEETGEATACWRAVLLPRLLGAAGRGDVCSLLIF
ncbi:hypothetical protein MATL_G00069240 [Megalops atlanticus]|uniref:Uncharacterized protein n=1 Tax=Megalops atlanticus TaxID=7932 RepID=A0A9D3TBS6_MEGAT|nr:hypothetical protein MATL_G00069240 [Megalops atlanticus]